MRKRMSKRKARKALAREAGFLGLFAEGVDRFGLNDDEAVRVFDRLVELKRIGAL